MKFSLLLSLVLSAVLFVEARPITPAEISRNSAKGLRLISLAEGVDPVWKTEDDVFALIRAGTNFVSLLHKSVMTIAQIDFFIVRRHRDV